VKRRRLTKRAGGGGPGWEDYVGASTAAIAAALGAGGSGSGTTTENEREWTQNHADGIKYKIVNISYKASKMGKLTRALSQPGHIFDHAASGGGSNQGQQGALLLTTFDAALYNELYKALNQTVAITPSTHSRKMYLGLQKTEIEFHNAGPTTLEFEVYTLIDKNTGALSSPGTIWDNAINAETNTATAPVEDKTDIWCKPTNYKLFRTSYWTKRNTCHLTPGESCKWTFNFNPKRLLDTSYLDDNASIRGITFHIMVVVRGTLADANKAKAVTPGSQTLSPTKLIWLMKRSMHGSILNTLPRVVQQRLLTSELPTALGSLWHQDEDGGLPEDAMLDANFA